MFNQEDLYQYIQKEQWSEILNMLHKHKKEISSDSMLKHAAKVFEQEFFRKIKDYPLDRKDIEDNLDKLYLLIHGKFYEVNETNYRILNVELVKRKPLKDAINYARHFPNNEICKNVIKQFEALEPNVEIRQQNIKPKPKPLNWVLIYNKLFELINNQGDKNTYFSGPRFLDIAREFNSYFPRYHEFINQRTNEGKSTSRKIYYYDILMSFLEPKRIEFTKRILDELRTFIPNKLQEIDNLLNNESPKKTETVSTAKTNSNNPIVFISYSWDSDTHKEWVLNLANRLCSDGVDVILDRYHLKPGKNLPYFVENSIEKSDRIIIVFTPNYKLKADKREGGVGYEYSIMNADLYKHQTTSEKLIPVLRAGSQSESIPTFMHQFVHLDICNDLTFENSYIDLLREIYNEPAITKPKVGSKPSFEKSNSDSVTQPKIGLKPEQMD